MAVIILGASPRGIQDYLIPEVYKWRSKLRGIPHPEANKTNFMGPCHAAPASPSAPISQVKSEHRSNSPIFAPVFAIS